MLALMLDVGRMLLTEMEAQNLADGAATSAATELRLGASDSEATKTATEEVRLHNGVDQAEVEVFIPPRVGRFAGRSDTAEVVVTSELEVGFLRLIGGDSAARVAARCVAGVRRNGSGAAIIALDPDPAPLSVAGVPLAFPALPSLLGGLEVLGHERAEVAGEVIVNCRWGGVDERGEPAGDGPGPPYGVSSTPVLPLTKLRCENLRVVGGVDDPRNYKSIHAEAANIVHANALPVPDPLGDLPVPTIGSDPGNVSTRNFGGRTIAALPTESPTVLRPGVYEWISVVSGEVVFDPGIYIIRGRDPVTGHALSLAAGRITAEGVMFYITNNKDYSGEGGSADALDGESEPASGTLEHSIPSVVMNVGLPGSSFAPLDAPESPFHHMLIFQRRHDRRPVCLVQEDLVGGGNVAGILYAKWGHVIFAGKGELQVSCVAGTARLIPLTRLRIDPAFPLPGSSDVYILD